MAAVLLGRMRRRAMVEVTGGALEVDWDEANGHAGLTGPAVRVYSGSLSEFAW